MVGHYCSVLYILCSSSQDSLCSSVPLFTVCVCVCSSMNIGLVLRLVLGLGICEHVCVMVDHRHNRTQAFFGSKGIEANFFFMPALT